MFDFNSQPPNNPNKTSDYDWGYAGFGQKGQYHDGYRRRFDGGCDQFRLETMEEDSGVCSPPLWRGTSPPGSPVQSRHHHNSNNMNPRYLSPTSRVQAIARGQQELMEMVNNMPETSYELSLKDIVEQRGDADETQSTEEGEERSILRGDESQNRRWKKKKKEGSVKRQESSKKVRIMMKNGSFDHNKGLLINMVFPFSFGSKKKSRNSCSANRDHSVGAKISPKPELLHKSGGGGDNRIWVWKRFSGWSDNESVGITDSNSGAGSTDRSGSSGSSTGGSVRSNSSRKNSGCIPRCWPFFTSRKKKS